MRLEKHLKEMINLNNVAEELLEKIKKDCKPFLKQMNIDKPLWRGSKDIVRNDYEKIKPRKDRRPRNTDPDLQVILDNVFNKKFGWKPRSSGVFCGGDKREAETYGNVYSVWPIGNFKFIWSERVSDLFVNFETEIACDCFILHIFWNDKNLTKTKECISKVEENVPKLYTDKNLAKAINSWNEVMIGCKEYYLVNEEVTRLMGEIK